MAKHHLPYPKKKHFQDNHLKFKVVPLPHWPLEDLSPPTVVVTIKTTHSQFSPKQSKPTPPVAAHLPAS
jgi:hypothetical protein